MMERIEIIWIDAGNVENHRTIIEGNVKDHWEIIASFIKEGLDQGYGIIIDRDDARPMSLI